jgi:3-hydroxyacyl-[acyl-carrier-protein] dehydratase
VPLSKALSRARRRPLFEIEAGAAAVDIGRSAIQRMLPHRDPLLLVDRLDAVDLEKRTARAWRRIDPDDPVLAGHFPGHPVYPGALLIEAMGQASLCLHHLLNAKRTTVNEDDVPLAVRLLRIHQGTFLAEVGPGDDVSLLCHQLEDDSFSVTCIAQAMVGERICAVAAMDVYLMDDE